ncbi:MAG: phosphoribosylglycinamide formyltransferase [Planctomycetes bacterium]|nr:phosphoribosylglycinamide formyltransferase [Planctomycetota bacterium]
MTTPARKPPLRLAVLISGSGTTLLNMIQRIDAGTLDVEIVLAMANTPRATGLQYADAAGIPFAVVDHTQFDSRDEFSRVVFDQCRTAGAEAVALAGFLRRLTIPDDFQNRVLNIHPALIPAFCGKGYYGHHVHEAAIDYGVKISGCTVHFVDNQYDHGPVILQKTVPVFDDDTPDDLDHRVRAAEREAYPEALQLLATGRLEVSDRRVRVLPE